MYIQTLQVFCDLAEAGSFSGGARLRGISQSAVSQQVSALEREFGVCLVNRSRGGLSLTAEGEAFLKACQEILGVYRQIPERLAAVEVGLSGEIRVAAVPSIGLYELPDRLKGFREAHPGVSVSVDYRRAPAVYAAVSEGVADIGLVAFPSRRTGLHTEVFDEDELVVICPPGHPLALEERLVARSLLAHRFVAFKPDIPTRRAVDRAFRGKGIRLEPHVEFDGVDLVKRAVEVEGGVSIVPRKTVSGEVARGVLVVRELEDAKLVRPLGMVFRHNQVRPPAWKSFIGALRRG